MGTDANRLVEAAEAAREHAYARYSGYRVGAALIDEHGDLHTGCNVENAAYPLGSCAEAGAISAMVAAGGTRIVAIAVAGGSDDVGICTPCGGCRQRIREFADAHTKIYARADDSGWSEFTIEELLPRSFTLL
ncbi:MAG: cytidine deaminase [Woeseiaceae bacterium]|nr:cytidine deaminase [Woeseiaceae bacterium]